MPVINVPAVIREKLGEDGTEALIKIFNEIEKNIKEDSIVILEEKFERRLSEELSKIREEIAQLKASLEIEINEIRRSLKDEIEQNRTSLKAEIEQTKASLKSEIEQIKTELKVGIAETKASLIRWMFVFWAGQIAVIIGLFSLLK